MEIHVAKFFGGKLLPRGSTLTFLIYLDFKHSVSKLTVTDLAPEVSICQLRNGITLEKVLLPI